MTVLDYERPVIPPRRGPRPIVAAVIVVLILAIPVIVVQVFRPHHYPGSRRSDARTGLRSLESALDMFEQDRGRYPTASEGLNILVQPIAPGPYLKGSVPLDPWGRNYVYHAPPADNPHGYRLVCLGPDGIEGTGDDIGDPAFSPPAAQSSTPVP